MLFYEISLFRNESKKKARPNIGSRFIALLFYAERLKRHYFVQRFRISYYLAMVLTCAETTATTRRFILLFASEELSTSGLDSP